MLWAALTEVLGRNALLPAVSEADLTDCACYTAVNGLVSHIGFPSYWTLPFMPSMWHYSSAISLMSFPNTHSGDLALEDIF